MVVIDTAGRLHNKKNLMEELKKINRIIDSKAGECSREILLVLDATTGQNAVNQAKLFSETAPITGIVLTKLDGTAKGGIVISIKNELGIPVKLIGVGEKIDDLQPFDSNMFVDALFTFSEDTEEDEEEEETEVYADDEDADEDIIEVDGVKGYYNEYGAFIPYEEDVKEEYDEESEDEFEEKETQKTPVVYEEEEEQSFTEADTEVEEESYETEDSSLTEESIDDEAETDEEEAEEESEAEPEPEKKKKKGFFSRLFGRKDDEDDN